MTNQYGSYLPYTPGELPAAMAVLAEQLELYFPGKTATWVHTPGQEGVHNGWPTIGWKLYSDTPPAAPMEDPA